MRGEGHMAKLNVGLIGLGRLGRVYARDLSTRIPCTRVVAVADVDKAAVEEVARRVRRREGATPIRSTLVDDPAVDAVVIVTPDASCMPRRPMAAAATGKAIFCEKPAALDRWTRRWR